ncbi:MAG: glycine betaine ABC transporter substrate-binding protein [Arhodomonas sp.]|nr:glycine betaine ABC transporter substrate-binding protein [Arhodomonas sp.]
MRLKLVTILATTLGLMLSTAVSAEEDFDCGSVRFGKVNWTGVSIKTATASWMLEQLGYNTEVTSASAPIVYQTIKGGELDVFLGQWMPSQRQVFRPFAREGSIDVVSPNLQGGKYTIGVPSYVYEAGVTSIEDLDAHKERFGGEIFGIEPGSGGNTTLTRMIEDDYAGLGDWELVASSEPGNALRGEEA